MFHKTVKLFIHIITSGMKKFKGGDIYGLIQEKNFSKKIIFRGKIMREIDCAQA
jgi:hypothetical protein